MNIIQLSSLTILSYLIFFFTGLNANIGGVALLDIAKKFGVNAYNISYLFTLAAAGGGLATFCTGFFLNKLNIKHLTIYSILATIAGYAGIISCKSLIPFALSILVTGTAIGTVGFLANYFIVHLYEDKQRTAQLNISNFFFSGGALISPVLVGQILLRGFSWEFAYLLIGTTLFVILAMALKNKINVTSDNPSTEKVTINEPWHINIYLIGIVFIFYAISELVFSNWITVYLRENLQIDVATASTALSTFWIFMAIGRFLSGYISTLIKVQYFIMLSCLLAFTAYIFLLHTTNITILFMLTGVMGLGYSGLYATILSYGTMQLNTTCPKLMTFYITLSCIGSTLCFLVSSFITQTFGVYTTLAASASSMGMVGLLIFATIIIDYYKRKAI